MPEWLNELLPILLLLAVVGVVYARLPKVELGHSPEFLRRRVQNWLPIGICYAFLYMGRYNLTVAKDAFGERMDNTDFATIFAVGTWVYGLSFLINGPLTDKFGGRATILVGAVGAAVANLLMGLLTHMKIEAPTCTSRALARWPSSRSTPPGFMCASAAPLAASSAS